MMTKLRTLASLYRELGLRWSAFRLAYAFRLRTGLIRLQMPQYKWTDRPLETRLKKDIPFDAIAYTQRHKQNSPKFFFRAERSNSEDEARIPKDFPWNKQTAIEEADRILNGEIKYFAHEFHHTGFPPNWHKDYFTGHLKNVTLRGASRHEGSLPQQHETLRSQKPLPQSDMVVFDSTKHWSQISDDADVDIKFIWEPNRFSFVYTLVRGYAASQDEKYAEAFWQSILDWAEHNPPNTGANWMDGQEISLRLMAWTFGYDQFSNSPSTTPERTAKFTLYVAAQAERIYKNIDYAISTRSNHTISEAFGLWLVGLLFPELKDAEKYLSLGRRLLEQEASRQIFPDGSYSMYSLNYHRFILHIYLYAIRLGEINHSPFSTQLQNSVANSINYLSQLIDPKTGQMPVYGSNDGALVLPLNNCDFTDYRPLSQLGSFITKGERLFDPGAWDEDLFWLWGMESPSPLGRRARDEGETNFPDGGTYLLRGSNSKAIIHCTDFRARPSHADQLHVDLWLGDQNIACDAGTYLYSGEDRRWRNGLARTPAHNTVIVDNKDQMTMASRFTWTNWAKGKVLQHDAKLWQGEHDGYTRLSDPVNHKRTVLSLSEDRWLVVDYLTATQSHHYALHWLFNDFPYEQKDNSILLSLESMKYKMQVGLVEGKAAFSVVRADPNSTRGWRSRYYGHKEPALSAKLETHQPQTIFWSFLGFENDVVKIEGESLKVNSQNIPLVE